MLPFIPVLSLLCILPIIAIAVLCAFNDEKNSSNYIKAKYIAASISFLHLIIVFLLAINFNRFDVSYQYIEIIPIISSINFSYNLGIDGISLIFLFISSLVIFIVIAFVKLPTSHYKIYLTALLFILLSSTIVFSSRDLILFFLFYEFSVIPVFFILGVLGDYNRVYASMKFVLYTVFGSIFMLLSIIAIVSITDTSSLTDIRSFTFDKNSQIFIFLGLFIAFAIKAAIFPFHTWLPDTYESSPFFLNIILSAVLMKFAIYGVIKIILPIFPIAIVNFVEYIYIICFITIVYASILAYKEDNIKRLFGYFSMAHVALIFASLFSVEQQGIEGGIIQSFSHSLYNLGILLTFIYISRKFSIEKVSTVSGLSSVMPKASIVLFLFGLAAMGFPLTASFIGEVFMLFGLFINNRIYAFLLSISLILSAIVMVRFYKNLIFGTTHSYLENIKDIKNTHIFPLALIIIIIFIIGIQPYLILDYIHYSVANIVNYFQQGLITQERW